MRSSQTGSLAERAYSKALAFPRQRLTQHLTQTRLNLASLFHLLCSSFLLTFYPRGGLVNSCVRHSYGKPRYYIPHWLASLSCIRNMDSGCAVFVFSNTNVATNILGSGISSFCGDICLPLYYRDVFIGGSAQEIFRLSPTLEGKKYYRGLSRISSVLCWFASSVRHNGAIEWVLLVMPNPSFKWDA
jgi:hypothetical protein